MRPRLSSPIRDGPRVSASVGPAPPSTQGPRATAGAPRMRCRHCGIPWEYDYEYCPRCEHVTAGPNTRRPRPEAELRDIEGLIRQNPRSIRRGRVGRGRSRGVAVGIRSRIVCRAECPKRRPRRGGGHCSSARPARRLRRSVADPDGEPFQTRADPSRARRRGCGRPGLNTTRVTGSVNPSRVSSSSSQSKASQTRTV